jgi:hypothetical protein
VPDMYRVYQRMLVTRSSTGRPRWAAKRWPCPTTPQQDSGRPSSPILKAPRFLRASWQQGPSWSLLAGGQLLHGPAVAVRIAEEDERAPVELLDFADLDPTLNEFGACGLYV